MMQCTSPWTHKVNETQILLPCGHCRACRIAKSREWYVRLWHELSYSDRSIFITLSYADENLPKDFQIHKEELQLFIKRLRRRVPKIKYYGCGEYGDEKQRPHYHAIIFGVDITNHKYYRRWNHKTNKYALVATEGPCYDSWDKGEVILGFVEKDSLRYTTDYIHKKLSGPSAEEDGRIQPFSLKSNGLGKQFALDNEEVIRNQQYLTVFGQKLRLPRYYVKVLGMQDELVSRHALDPNDDISLGNWNEFYTKEEARRKQRALNLKTKEQLFSRRSNAD
jgi:hypothetical protein